MPKSKEVPETDSPKWPDSVCDMGKPDYEGPVRIGSLDLTSEEGAILYLNTRSEPDFRAEDMNGEIFAVVHWVCSRQHFSGKEPDEDRDGIRLVFIDPEGRTLSTSSEAVGRFLDDMLEVRGIGPYAPPIRMSLSPTTNRAGRKTYKVRIIPNDKS